MRIIILLLVLGVWFNSYSQMNRVEKVIEKISENDFSKALSLIEKLNDETPIVLNHFLLFSIYDDVDYSSRNMDSAYFYLRLTLNELPNLNTVQKEEFCIRFQLCDKDIKVKRIEIEKKAFEKYSRDSSTISINHFIQYYDNDQLKENALKLIELIDYNKTVEINSIKEFRLFLAKYPNSDRKQIINSKIEDLEFQSVIFSNEEKLLREFLANYSTGKYKRDVQLALGKLRYNLIRDSYDLLELKIFLDEFSNRLTLNDLSNENRDIQERYCSIFFHKVKNCQVLDSLNDFLWDCSESVFSDSIELRIETIEYKKLVENFSTNQANVFLNEHPNSIYNEIIKDYIDSIEYNLLQKNFSIMNANLFLKNYPNSHYTSDVLKVLFDLEFKVISQIDDNSKISDFILKYNQYDDFKDKLEELSILNIYTSNDDYPLKYGFINSKDSNIQVYPIYNELRLFSNGLSAARYNLKWGYIDKKGNVVIDFIYDEVKDFKEGYAGVKLNGLWRIINKKNIPINNQDYQDVGEVNCGLINVKTLTKGWVFISTNGQIKSKGIYYYATSSFNFGYAFVQESNSYKIIDTSFTTIYQVNYELPLYNNYSIYDACSNFEVSFERNILCDFYERRTPYSLIRFGNALLLNEGLVYDLKTKQCWISEYCYFDNEILVFGNRRTSRNQEAILTFYSRSQEKSHLTQVINIQTDALGLTPEINISRKENSIVLNNKDIIQINFLEKDIVKKWKLMWSPGIDMGPGNCYYINQSGNILGDNGQFDYATEFVNGRAIVGVSGKQILIDEESNQIGGVFDRVILVNSNRYIVSTNAKFYLMNRNGEILSKQYTFIEDKMYNYCIIVHSGNLKGYIDVNGNEIIKPQYLEAKGFSNGKAIVVVGKTNTPCFSWECKSSRVIVKDGSKASGDFKKSLSYTPTMKY